MIKNNEKFIQDNKKKLKTISMFKYGCYTANDDTIGAITAGDFQNMYDVDFHSFTTGNKKQDVKIELMNELKKKVAEVSKRSSLKKVDMRNKVDERLDGIYTTKHFVYGSFIKEVFVEVMRTPQNQRQALKKSSKSNTNRRNSRAK